MVMAMMTECSPSPPYLQIIVTKSSSILTSPPVTLYSHPSQSYPMHLPQVRLYALGFMIVLLQAPQQDTTQLQELIGFGLVTPVEYLPIYISK